MRERDFGSLASRPIGKEQLRLESRVNELEDQLTRAKAENAVMRKALKDWQNFGWLKPREENFILCNMGNTKRALSSTAGQDLLDQHTVDKERIAELTEEKIKNKVSIKALENVLEKMVFAYINKDADCPHQFEKEALRLAEFVGTEQTAKFARSALGVKP
jgi:hypothetical protein